MFFYSNEFGSRVYFDDLGPPWPKHPCTDTGIERLRGSTHSPLPEGAGLTIRGRVTRHSVDDLVHVPGAFIVNSVVRRGPKRFVTLQEIGGEQIEIVVSPPAPPAHAIAVAISWELHWFDPRSGKHGKELRLAAHRDSRGWRVAP